ncbi:hypothetical protein D9M70_564910 [compost metagenome]
MQVFGQAYAALAHDGVVVPAKDGFRHRAEQVHPALGGTHPPVEAQCGQSCFLAEVPAADSFEVPFNPPLQQAQALHPGHP